MGRFRKRLSANPGKVTLLLIGCNDAVPSVRPAGELAVIEEIKVRTLGRLTGE